MSSSTTAAPVASITLAKGKLILRTPRKVQEAADFFHTLPGSRWDQSTMAWKADATPSAAWRAVNCCPIATEPSSEALALAAEFAASLNVLDVGSQPAARKTDGWRHQLEAYHFAYPKAGALLAMGMGCGKSWDAVNLIVNKQAGRSIILCPLAVLGVWRREFEKHAGLPVDVLVLEKGSCLQKARKADEFLQAAALAKRLAVVVINYESAWREDFAKWALSIQWDVAVCDESHKIKAHDSQVSKFAGKLGLVARYRLCLTGTPMPHSPLDLFGQYRFLDRGIFGTWFHHFRSRYAKLNPVIPGQVDEWINQDELKARMALIAYRVTADEVLDLPPFNHHELRVKLGSKARKVYDGLENDLIAAVGSGVVTATNALTRLLRLQQVTSGFITEDETKKEIDLDDEKALALFELIDDIGGEEPIVVFCRFRHDLSTVARIAERLGRTYGELSGRAKTAIDDRSCMAPGVQVAGVQIASGGAGIDLTAARYAAYFSLGFNLGELLQSYARLHRPGQTRHVHYYHLVASGTVDEVVYRALAKREDLINAVLGVLKRG